MPDREPAGFSRVCPSCGRRVPRSVPTCRCGAELPIEASAAVPEVETADGNGASSPQILALVALLALGGAAYWMFMRPAPATAPGAFATADAPGSGLSATAAPNVSPERRAWDAAAADATAAPPGSPSRDAATPANPTSSLATAGLTPALEDMVDQAMPAIVLVETTSGRGSAFFVQHDTLITNVHVVQNDAYVTLRRMDGTAANARVHSKAPAFDIAVLKIGQPSPTQVFLPMGSAQTLKPGQEVIVIGSALGTLQNSVSRGIVSGLRSSGGVTLVQTDAAANPGNSGGPMLDRNGRVVGITTAGYRESQGLNFAVSIDHAKDILDGKQVSLGSTATALRDIKPMVPGGSARSESDRRQEQGEEEFLGRIESAAEASEQLDTVWSRFRQGCYKAAIPGRYDREWFAVFVPQGIPGDAAAGCIDFYRQMSSEMQKFRTYMRQTIDGARRANVLPGTIRDALRKNRLQFDGWDR